MLMFSVEEGNVKLVFCYHIQHNCEKVWEPLY